MLKRSVSRAISAKTLLFLVLIPMTGRTTEIIQNQASTNTVATITQYSFSQEGDPKYPTGFKHYDYVNPNAPQGGVLKRAVVQGTYSTFNGDLPNCDVVAPGKQNLFGGLMTWALDDYNTLYPYVAKSLQIAVDKSFVIFNLNENAFFNDPSNDGCDPKKPAKRERVTAEDVKFSYEMLKAHGAAGAKSYFKDIESVEIVGDNQIKFNIKPENWKSAVTAAGDFNIFSKNYHSGKSKEFNRCSRDPIPGTGAYIVESANEQTVKYKRACNHWAEKVPSRVGHNNFDRIRYEIYRDWTAVEGSFRNKEADVLPGSTNQWPEDVNDVTKGKNMFQDARTQEAIKNKEITIHQLSTPYDGNVREMAFNSKNPALKDRRVRKALSLLYESEFIAADTGRGQTNAATTYFPAAKPELASEEKVRALLERQKERHGDVFPNEALKSEKTIDTKGKTYAEIFRERAAEANRLMREAGWRLQPDPEGSGKQVWMNGQKKFPTLFVPTTSPGQYMIYQKRLQEFGINTDVRRVGDEMIDGIQKRNQYDITARWFRHDPVPGPELNGLWSREAASVSQYSENLSRTSTPVVDELMETVVNAPTRQDRQVAIEALNRVLKAEHPSILLPRAQSSIYVAKRSHVGGAIELPTKGRINTATTAEETWWDKTLKPSM